MSVPPLPSRSPQSLAAGGSTHPATATQVTVLLEDCLSPVTHDKVVPIPAVSSVHEASPTGHALGRGPSGQVHHDVPMLIGMAWDDPNSPL